MAKKKQTTVEAVEEKTATVGESITQPTDNCNCVDCTLPVPAPERDLITIDDEIDDSVIERIIQIGDEEVQWLRNSTGGFKVSDDDTRREVTGCIFAINNYLIAWHDGSPERMDDPGTRDLPPGFERRVDLKIVTTDGYRLGISIPGASLRKNFAGYLKKLSNAGLKPNEVWTKFRCSERKAKDLEGNAISFPFIEALEVGRVEPVPF